MRRRDFLSGVGMGFASIALPRRATSQLTDTKLIIFLSSLAVDDPQNQIWVDAISEGLAAEGWSVGSNLMLEVRHTGGSFEEARRAAEEAIAIEPDLILAVSNRVSLAVVEGTSEIPIVFGLVADPVRIGLVNNIVAPGGNATGFTISDPTIYGKRFELLLDLSPQIETIGFLYSESADGRSVYDPLRAGIDADAAALGVSLRWLGITTIEQAQHAIIDLSNEANAGLCVPSDTFNWVNRIAIVDSVNRTNLPAIYTWPPMTEIGGLMSYDATTQDSVGRMGNYAGRVLNGVDPGVLPVQGPSSYGLILNLITAEAQGIAIPSSLVALADKIIE